MDFQLENIITIKALIIQSSHIKEMPHEVTSNFRPGNTLEISQTKCSAVGASECFKHVAAIFLYINRTQISNIDTLSSTDVRCEWSRLRDLRPSLQQYSPVPLLNVCCCKPIVSISNGILSGEDIRHHHNQLWLCTQKVEMYLVLKKAIKKILMLILMLISNYILLIPHNMLDIVDKFPVNELKNCCLAKYAQLLYKYTDTEYIRNKSLKDKIFWIIVRQFRITGSQCYLLYTYKKTLKLKNNGPSRLVDIFGQNHLQINM